MKGLTIGTFVNYVCDNGEIAAAVVTRVHTDECCNLQVFLDGYNRDGQPIDFKPSSVYSPKERAPGTWHYMKT